MTNTVRVGVAVIIEQAGQWLLGKRINAHGAETWAFPGGHLEWQETPEDCAVREAKEEVGIDISDLRRLGFTNDIFTQEDKHYITLFIQAAKFEGEIQVMEPDKCLEWQWFDRGALPTPLFLPIQHFIEQI